MNCLVIMLMLVIVTGGLCCETPCTKEMHPVCATDGARFQIFSNECVMKNQRCRDGKSWVRSDLRSCVSNMQVVQMHDETDGVQDVMPTCLKPCSSLAMPVCGYDGTIYKVFGNDCAMSNTNCMTDGGKVFVQVNLEKCYQLSSFGRRRSLSLSSCPMICPANYVPTCGFNGEEYTVFGNSCALNAFNCLKTENWHRVPLELCPREFYE